MARRTRQFIAAACFARRFHLVDSLNEVRRSVGRASWGRRWWGILVASILACGVLAVTGFEERTEALGNRRGFFDSLADSVAQNDKRGAGILTVIVEGDCGNERDRDQISGLLCSPPLVTLSGATSEVAEPKGPSRVRRWLRLLWTRWGTGGWGTRGGFFDSLADSVAQNDRSVGDSSVAQNDKRVEEWCGGFGARL